MALNRGGVAADEQWSEEIVYGGFDDGGRVEGLAEADDAGVGVDVDPDNLGLRGGANGFGLGDAQGEAPGWGRG